MELKEILTIAGLVTIGISGISILTGVTLILNKKEKEHKIAMLTACTFASIFVVIYLIKSAMFEPTRYVGDHKNIYLFILLSHTILAALNLPLAIRTVYLGLKDQRDKHKKIAPYTAGVWIYVAITGWTIYFILH